MVRPGRLGMGLVLLLSAAGPETHQRDPIGPLVSLRYAGGADGAPVLDDLAAIKAVGFDAVAWPDSRAAELSEVRRQADVVGLTVVALPPPVPLTPARARAPGAHIDVRVTDADARAAVPLVWRAIAHGARSVAFDAGGATLSRADGSPAPWVAPAVAIARQLSANRRLVDLLRAGPAVVVDPAGDAADLDVALLDGGRAWVIVATNLSASPVAARATFPKGVPSGLWASWLDDSAMSMLHQPTGPRWTVEMDGFGTLVFLIDKSAKT